MICVHPNIREQRSRRSSRNEGRSNAGVCSQQMMICQRGRWSQSACEKSKETNGDHVPERSRRSMRNKPLSDLGTWMTETTPFANDVVLAPIGLKLARKSSLHTALLCSSISLDASCISQSKSSSAANSASLVVRTAIVAPVDEYFLTLQYQILYKEKAREEN
jgi:hypothetical protein